VCVCGVSIIIVRFESVRLLFESLSLLLSAKCVKATSVVVEDCEEVCVVGFRYIIVALSGYYISDSRVERPIGIF
jgi:hypothetical protein